jgi:hypothetical protein
MHADISLLVCSVLSTVTDSSFADHLAPWARSSPHNQRECKTSGISRLLQAFWSHQAKVLILLNCLVFFIEMHLTSLLSYIVDQFVECLQIFHL